MKVYRFVNDHDFKELTFLNEEEDVGLFASFNKVGNRIEI